MHTKSMWGEHTKDAKGRALKKKMEQFTIVKGHVPSTVTREQMHRMNNKYGGAWPVYMDA